MDTEELNTEGCKAVPNPEETAPVLKLEPQEEAPKDSHLKETAVKKGYASIKEEFLLPDYKPSLSADYISLEMKSKMAAKGEQISEKTCEGKNENENGDSCDNEESEPPSKKAKLKGRNKQRPRNERIEAKDKLCPAIKENRECRFGDNCKFNHSKQEFMSKKLPELDGKCYLFDTFGYCQYGITCRFAHNHLTESLQNVVKDDVFEKMKSKKKFLNELHADTRQKLWKKKYNFKKADSVTKDVQKTFRGWGDKEAVEIECGDGKSQSNPTNMPDNGSTTLTNVKSSEEEAQITSGNTETSRIPSLSECQPQDGQSKEITERYVGCITDEEVIRIRPEEKKKIDLKNKLYLAPLTTVGNLPFRRICKDLGAEVTCGEMALVTQLLKAKQSEWSLIKRHPCEDIFGVQVCGSYPDTMTRCAQLLTENCSVDFIDINCGCPIDLIYRKGGGSALMGKATKLEQICRSMIGVMGNTPLTVKLRKGVFDDRNVAHQIIPRLRDAGVSLVTIHGRSREQRYTRQADWDYISQCATAGLPMPIFGNGDILSFEEANLHMETHGVSGVMLARGALIKPWLFTEIKEQRHWDISANERLDILRDFSNFGLEHWGSDYQGVENTRRFMLEWLSFLHRYIPVGVLEQVPQRINERPPYYVGRNDLETLMASANCADWVKISEMLLGPVPPNFKFLPKHKANAYQ